MNQLQNSIFSSDRLPDRQPRACGETQRDVRAKPGPASFGVGVLAFALLITSTPVLAEVTVYVWQRGNDVVFSGGGTLNTTDIFAQPPGFFNLAGTDFGTEFVLGGQTTGLESVKVFGGNADVTEPNNLPFGIDQFFQPNANTGDRFGVTAEGAFNGQVGPAITAPPNYTSGAPLCGRSIYSNRTIASMGLIAGTYQWTWGTANADSLTLIIGDSPPAVGDHNGDGKSDILWRNSADGRNSIWYMNGAVRIAQQTVPTVSDTNWKIEGRGDHNNDGEDDILWRKSNPGQGDDGQMAVWLLRCGTLQDNLPLPTVSTDWQIVGSGDYNANGHADILWRNVVTGENAIWFITDGTLTANIRIPFVGDLDWTVVSDGDFNGDGNADILWRNSSTGQMALWRMIGAALDLNQSVPTVSDPNWVLMADGDYNGDNRSDLFWRNTSSGQTVLWLMNGGTLTANVILPYLATTDWQVVGDDGDYNGDGMADLFWRNTLIGFNSMWLMDTATRIGHQAVPTQPIGGWNVAGID